MLKIMVFTAVILVALTALIIAVRHLLILMIDKRIERFQSELIEKQIRETQEMYRQMRGWRHDYRNHIQNMKILLHDRKTNELDGYLDSLAQDLMTVDTVLKTGNVMADSVLNTKLSIAQKLDIRTTVKTNIPQDIPLTDVELCALLGNLLDNAVEACARVKEGERFLRIYIGVLKGQFYLSVQNSAGEVHKSGESYFSTKENPGEHHGYGIFRIDRIVRKYGGYVNRQNEQGIFATELMIPMPEDQTPSSEETVHPL